MNLDQVIQNAINPAMALLSAGMDSPAARVMLLAIGLQESRFEHRYQVVQGRPGAKGPARGFWQFERGTAASRGGVWGVFLHPESAALLKAVALARGVPPSPSNIWERLETDDVLAAAVARLLLWTDSKPLPKVEDVQGAWNLYAIRTWRPGKPHRQTWDAFHAQALAVVAGVPA